MRSRVCLIGSYDIALRLPFAKRLVEEGFEVVLVGSVPDIDLSGEAFITYKSYSYQKSLLSLDSLRALVQISRCIKLAKPDIVHSFDVDLTILGPIANLLSKSSAKSVVTINGLGSAFSGLSFSKLFYRIIYLVSQFSVSFINSAYVFQNGDDYKFFRSFCPHKTGSFSLIYGSGVSADVGEVSVDLDKQKRIKRVIYVSRLLPEKGILQVISIARSVEMTSSTPVEFIVVGSLPSSKLSQSYSVVQDAIKRAPKNMIFTGPLKHESIFELMMLSDIFIFPSKYREGLPRVLLEAITCNLFVLTFDRPGCREVIVDGINGILIRSETDKEFVQEIFRYAGNVNDIQMRSSVNKLLLSKRFGYSRVVASYANIYRSLIDCG